MRTLWSSIGGVLLAPLALTVQAQPTFEAATLEGAFSVEIYPRKGEMLVGRYHQWVIRLQDAQGEPVEQARVTVGGGMQAHGHGLPSKPQVTRYLGDGEHLIEGMLFNMTGAWTLLFVVQTPDLMDRVRFDFDVEH